MRPFTQAALPAELYHAFKTCRAGITGIATASGVINLLVLTGPLFMLQVYDRVLSSRSVPTLVGLVVVAVVLFAFLGILDAFRGRLLQRVGRTLSEQLSGRIFNIAIRSGVEPHAPARGLQPLRDLDNVRSAISSNGLTALFDLPWMPLYLIVCFVFHPVIGWVVLIGAVLLCALAFMTDVLARQPSRDAVDLATARLAIAEAAHRNAGPLLAMGMVNNLQNRWLESSAAYHEKQSASADMTADFGSLSRILRTILQSSVLAIGAYLVIKQETTAGVILAATILSARALAPVELAVAHWRTFVAARQSWARLSDDLRASPPPTQRTSLPPPSKSLRVSGLSIAAPGGTAALLHDVSFNLQCGSALGVIGPSGSGKSSLARALVGILRPTRGIIRLDDATFDRWPSDVLGAAIGYLPQDVALVQGTVAQNIARFRTDASSRSVVAAARAAGVHEIILRMANGYETEVGEGGALLAGGQRQRIALARALFGDPFLVVLDEPNSNLDAQGEQALVHAIHAIRARGAIAVVVAHRPSALTGVDYVLMLNEGRMQAFGPRDVVLKASPPRQARTRPQLKRPAQPRSSVASTLER